MMGEQHLRCCAEKQRRFAPVIKDELAAALDERL